MPIRIFTRSRLAVAATVVGLAGVAVLSQTSATFGLSTTSSIAPVTAGHHASAGHGVSSVSATAAVGDIGERLRKGTGAVASSSIWLGTPQALGNGAIATYVLRNGDTPTSIGYAMTGSALDGLPAGHNDGKRCFDVNGDGTIQQMEECVGGYEKRLPLPSTQGWAQPYSFGMVNWNPMGHSPIYTSPHFDFHFYLDSQAQVDGIRLGPCWGAVNCDDFQRAIKPVPAQFMPRDYQDFQGVEAKMGNHMGDVTSPEFSGQPFTKTFVYGKYDGRISFLEPMITRATLQSVKASGQASCSPVKQSISRSRSGWYPTSYCIRYVPVADVLTVSLEGLRKA